MKGGSVETVLQLVETTPISPVIVNPASNFVVVTYWWGTGNLNRNLQRPCPEDVMEPIKEAMEEELAEEDEDFKQLYEHIGELNKKRKSEKGLTDSEKEDYKKSIKEKELYSKNYFARADTKAQMNARYVEAVAKLKVEGKFVEPVTFNQMIETWKETCKKANCNYLVQEYPIERADYQNGINAKPAFIKKALDACPGRGVLYIDGDMYVNKYPAIFDVQNVDYMARGWNVDPRSSSKYKTDVCFDPYVFETSGGTMYFGNTPLGRELIDQWASAMNDPINKGKAEDRIISMIVTTSGFATRGNLIQLPIEYLWLTDNYKDIDPLDARQPDSFIEHPACLTGEERASDQGAASNRQPEGYDSKVSNIVECTKRGGKFYEYIFFPTKELVSSFADYLKYIECAKNFETKEFLFEVIPFDDQYGLYNSVAFKNDTDARAISITETGVAKLEKPSIPEILANLYAGRDVQIGEITPAINSEFTMTNNKRSDDPHVKIDVDVSLPMYISSSNSITQHLLRMCETLKDINKHLKESYVFVSRIRWGETGEVSVSTPVITEREPLTSASIGSRRKTPRKKNRKTRSKK